MAYGTVGNGILTVLALTCVTVQVKFLFACGACACAGADFAILQAGRAALGVKHYRGCSSVDWRWICAWAALGACEDIFGYSGNRIRKNSALKTVAPSMSAWRTFVASIQIM